MRDRDFIRSIMTNLEAERPAIELVRDARGVWRAPGEVRDAYARDRKASTDAMAPPLAPGQRLWAWMQQTPVAARLGLALQFFRAYVRDWKTTGPRPTQQPA